MLRVTARLVADAALVAALLFVAAGTPHWWRAGVPLAVLLLVRARRALARVRGAPPTVALQATRFAGRVATPPYRLSQAGSGVCAAPRA